MESGKNVLGREHSGCEWLTEKFVKALHGCPLLMEAARDVVEQYEGRPQRQEFWLAKLLWDATEGRVPGVPPRVIDFRPDLVNFEGMDFAEIREVAEGRNGK